MFGYMGQWLSLICELINRSENTQGSDLTFPFSILELCHTAASIARKIYIRGGIGTGEFRKIYGGRKRRGMKPARSSKAAGGVIRSSLKQLEKLGIIEKDPNGGRRLTRKGQAEMDTQAAHAQGSA